jgi:hypothetical protein
MKNKFHKKKIKRIEVKLKKQYKLWSNNEIKSQ